MTPILDPLTLIVFALVPIIVAILKQTGWSKEQNSIVALAVYVIAGVAFAYANQPAEGLTALNLITWITEASVVGTAAYAMFWKNFEQPLVNATSLIKPPA